ncbi:hypothetical protein [Endozoicomonas sp. YOMI1]|uniref:hypothetical protein n=1 Tax=Endozoicomonas sp. YOMI1 TaxID=2828739 RepID=UPI002147C12A|nr:hypothetical protein [Endozoicomonas sp. YOMI1]
MIKWMPIIVFMVLFLVLPGRSEANYPGKFVPVSQREALSSSTNDAVIVDSENSWLTGILVGNPGAREWVNGILWSSGELAVHASEVSQLAQYPPFQYLLSVEATGRALWKDLVATQDSEAFVFSFRSKAFWRSPFSSESDFILTDITPLAEDFSVSHSFKAFPEGVEVDWDYHSHWFYREKVARGLVTRIQRINRRLLSNLCIIDIHLGGSRDIVSYRDEWIPAQSFPRESVSDETGSTLEKKRGARIDHQLVPDVGQFTTYQESLCRYAEDAAASSQEVNILYSDFWDSSERLVEAEVYKIWVRG